MVSQLIPLGWQLLVEVMTYPEPSTLILRVLPSGVRMMAAMCQLPSRTLMPGTVTVMDCPAAFCVTAPTTPPELMYKPPWDWLVVELACHHHSAMVAPDGGTV